jgi:hypothetical protein
MTIIIIITMLRPVGHFSRDGERVLPTLTYMYSKLL